MGTTVFSRGALLFVPVTMCLLSSAQVRAETPKLALPQVVEFSIKNNGDLKSFRAEKGIRDAGKTRAGLLPNPTLEFEGGTGALTGNSAEHNLSIGVSQEFLLFGKRAKRLALAERELEMYLWQAVDRERLLREEVKAAFYDVVLADKQVALTDRFIALNRQVSDVTKERLDAGDIPELEMNLVQVELARSEAARIAAEKTLTQSRAKLLTLMGQPVGEFPGFTGEFETVSLSKNLAELKKQALGNRPDLKALEVERDRGESDIILARAEGFPNLTAGLALKRDTTAIEVGGVEGQDSAHTIVLRLSMPIPVFDRNQGGVQEARARQGSTQSRLSAAAITIEREVETAYASFKNAEKVLSLYRTTINPQLEANLKLTLEAYSLGEVGILAVIQEQKKFFEVSEGYLTAQHDRQVALLKLESNAAVELSGGVQ